MRKPNYRFERAERDRLKRAKKEEKARRQQERGVPEQSDEADPAGASAGANVESLHDGPPDQA
jgi:hypothetical protein